MSYTHKELDRELLDFLSRAEEMQPVTGTPAPVHVVAVWPWQVPQVPAYTSDSSPAENR